MKLDHTLGAQKTILLSIVALSLILTASHSHAGLGWTLAQFKQQYGKSVLNHELIAGRIGYVFKGEDYIIAAYFLNSQVSRIIYICRSGSVFSWGRARALLGANAPDAIWADASKNEADNSYRVNGTKDGVETYYALLTEDGKMLVIWTKEDDETGRTSPKPDTSPIFSVMGSNERSTSGKIVGQAARVERELTPKVSQPDVQTNAASSSLAERPVSARVIHTKMRRVRFRSSMPHRHFDAKRRLIALWHQSLRHEKSRGVTRFSHSNKVRVDPG